MVIWLEVESLNAFSFRSSSDISSSLRTCAKSLTSRGGLGFGGKSSARDHRGRRSSTSSIPAMHRKRGNKLLFIFQRQFHPAARFSPRPDRKGNSRPARHQGQ